MPGMNTGQVAQANSMCQVPSASNRCLMEFDTSLRAWMYKSNQWGVTCCNCFQLRPVPPCPLNSLPFHICDFQAGPSNELACWPGVNTGEAASPDNGECSPPSAENHCLLQFDQGQGAWMWSGSNTGKPCCNCFQAKMATSTGSLLQQQAAAVQRHSHLRHPAPEGDTASMLQMPAAGADGDAASDGDGAGAGAGADVGGVVEREAEL